MPKGIRPLIDGSDQAGWVTRLKRHWLLVSRALSIDIREGLTGSWAGCAA